MVKIKDFTLSSKTLGAARAPSFYTPPAHAYTVVILNSHTVVIYL